MERFRFYNCGYAARNWGYTINFAQDIKIDGAIIISTPQEMALLDVKRGIQMFDKTGINIIGLVENMSFFKGDDGKNYNIFGEGGVERTAKEFSKEFLGKIPFHQDLRISSDKGKPLTLSNPKHEISKIYENISKKILNKFI
jgi:ATP-binding protein involved in chromosome partitioning